MLTQGMGDEIEIIQKFACKLLFFGWESSYDNLIISDEIESFDSRRENLMLKFAKKASNSERFKHRFKRKDYGKLDLREGNVNLQSTQQQQKD